MDKSKNTVERSLRSLLDELLEYGNQDGSIISVHYDEENEKAIVEMNVHIVEEDNYIGFAGY